MSFKNTRHQEKKLMAQQAQLADENADDPDAARKYKSIGLGLNKYEYDLLIKLAEKEKNTLLMTIRKIIVDAAKNENFT